MRIDNCDNCPDLSNNNLKETRLSIKNVFLDKYAADLDADVDDDDYEDPYYVLVYTTETEIFNRHPSIMKRFSKMSILMSRLPVYIVFFYKRCSATYLVVHNTFIMSKVKTLSFCYLSSMKETTMQWSNLIDCCY